MIMLTCAGACSDSGPRCKRDRELQDWGAAIVSCQAELERTHDPARAVDTALAAYYLQQFPDAERFATLALHGPAAADAHYVVGAARLALGQHASAASHLRVAAMLHSAAGNARAEARDRHQLAGAAFQLADYREALLAEEAAREAARSAHDDRMVVYLDIARADVLREIGDLYGAEVAIEQAIAGARSPEDHITAWLKRGILHIEEGNLGLARDSLTRALEAEPAARQRLPMLAAAHLNLSYVERKAHRFPRAFEELELAKQSGADPMQYRLNHGLVLADMGQLGAAAADLQAAEAEGCEGEWAWWVPFQRARVAARLNDIPTAIDEDRLAIAQVTAFASRLGSLGPTMIANHREPHLHLVGLLAADRRWDKVLDVVAAMDGQSLLASSEPPSDTGPSVDPPGRPTFRRPQGPARPIAFDAANRAVQAWRGQRLVIVVRGGDHVWRIDVRDGKVSGRDVGDANALEARARTLETDPDNLEAGRALGAAMLAPDLPLHARVALLVIGPMARAPLAGLRVGDAPAIARYQLMRAPGLLPRAPVQRTAAPAIAIGDPGGDLPAAAAEVRQVAQLLKGRAFIGAAATRAAFASAAGADVMHVAAHTTQRADGATLDLVDGPVTTADIAKLTPAPRLVVMASCGAAAGRDDAGNGSLVTAFLDAGADAVVGTRWSVGDAEAAELIEAFYADGGDRDPVQALGVAQLGSKLPVRARAAFEVFVARPAQ